MSIWDYKGRDTDILTHGIHLYPAVMNPYVARRLISLYGKEASKLIDPFCGSGTTLVEAKKVGLRGDGFDLNPIARLISRVKTRTYDTSRLGDYLDSLIEDLMNCDLAGIKTSIKASGFDEDKITTWFPEKSIREIHTYLSRINDDESASNNHKEFALVALSDCLRQVSIQRNNEWKNYRKSGWRNEDININYVPLLPILEKKLKSNFHRILTTNNSLEQDWISGKSEINIFDTNSVNESVFESTPENGYDLVVTSPPYGDSRTTVAYAEFSWMMNVWLGLDKRGPGKLSKEMMGGIRYLDVKPIGQRQIDSAISRMNEKNASKNFSFYNDYLKSIQNLSNNVKNGGIACFVVGNRTSGGQLMRMDLFTRWALEKNGFQRIGGIKTRVITNSKMPQLISPLGRKGIISSSMNKEFIITCRKIS